MYNSGVMAPLVEKNKRKLQIQN